MKKVLTIVSAAMLALVMGGCGANTATNTTADATNESAETSASGDTIVIGLDDEFPPMGFRDDKNELVGFDIDLAKACAEKMGVNADFQVIDWDSKEMDLETGKIDLIWNGFTITDDRLESMEFTKPYLDNNQVIVVKKDGDITKKSDLSGKVVGVQTGSSALDAIAKDPVSNEFSEMPTYDTNVLALNDLKIGRVDAVVMDEVVARYNIENGFEDYVVLDDNFGSEEYGVAAKKGNTELIEKVQDAIDRCVEDGTAEKISTEWFGENIVVNNAE
jgi:polar amino acid transport system substrate-binding protein